MADPPPTRARGSRVRTQGVVGSRSKYFSGLRARECGGIIAEVETQASRLMRGRGGGPPYGYPTGVLKQKITLRLGVKSTAVSMARNV